MFLRILRKRTAINCEDRSVVTVKRILQDIYSRILGRNVTHQLVSSIALSVLQREVTGEKRMRSRTTEILNSMCNTLQSGNVVRKT